MLLITRIIVETKYHEFGRVATTVTFVITEDYKTLIEGGIHRHTFCDPFLVGNILRVFLVENSVLLLFVLILW